MAAQQMCQPLPPAENLLLKLPHAPQWYRRRAQQDQDVCAEESHAAARAPQSRDPGRGGQVRGCAVAHIGKCTKLVARFC